MEERIQKVEDELATRSSAYRETSQPVTIELLQQELPPATALIEFFKYRPFDTKAKPSERWKEPQYVAYILRPSASPEWAELGEARTIEKAIEKFRDAIAKRRPDVSDSARKLDALKAPARTT